VVFSKTADNKKIPQHKDPFFFYGESQITKHDPPTYSKETSATCGWIRKLIPQTFDNTEVNVVTEKGGDGSTTLVTQRFHKVSENNWHLDVEPQKICWSMLYVSTSSSTLDSMRSATTKVCETGEWW
jgi:hypothetical protein